MGHHLYGYHEEFAKTTGLEDPYLQDKSFSHCPICQVAKVNQDISNHLKTYHNIKIASIANVFKPVTRPSPVDREEYWSNLFKQFFPDLEQDSKTEVKCPWCTKEFMADKFVDHYRKNHNYHCTICNITFPTHHSKAKHLAVAHNITSVIDRINLKKYECNICGQMFRNPYGLREHTKAMHEQIKRFLCDICGDGFRRKGTLRSHKRKHFNIKPYLCKLCDKRYGENTALKKHLKNVHNTELGGRWSDPLLDKESLPWRKLSEAEAIELSSSSTNDKPVFKKLKKNKNVQQNEQVVSHDFLYNMF